ncbi:MM3350-like domain-containing protein, partial [Vararia minispora EC-137]
WTLAHLLQREGEEMIWLYDYGDNYTHYIRVEEIASIEDSTGRVVVIDGSGACPREDGGGNSSWQEEDLPMLASWHPSQRAKIIALIRDSLNYKDKMVSKSFDPDAFDIAEARQRVQDALASPDSVWSGSKQFIAPLAEDSGTKRMPGPPGSMDPLKRGQKYERTWQDTTSYMQEVISTKRDRKSTSCCWTCGTPHGLSRYKLFFRGFRSRLTRLTAVRDATSRCTAGKNARP